MRLSETRDNPLPGLEPDNGWHEFSDNKLLVASATIGLTTSMNAVMLYGLGSFVAPLESEFGWARGDISLAATALTTGIFLSGPLVGRICDRFGAARVGTLSLLAFALALVLMPLLVTSLPGLWIAFFIIAVVGVGSTPIVLVRPITAAFDRRRGLALGIALTGAGLAGFWVPNLVTLVINEAGWRAAYWTLAACAAVAAPIVWLGFRPRERVEVSAKTIERSLSGMTIRQARTTAAFWLASLLALLMAFAIGGLIVHGNPLFRDLGLSATEAAAITSLIGIASSAGRLLIGACLDRFPTALVSVTVLTLGMLGILLLWVDGAEFGVLAMLLLGLLLGAELDLLAYLTSRLFGQRAFGTIYGWFYSMYSLGFGASPFVIGRMRDTFGNYDMALLVCIAVLAIAIMVMMAMRRSLKEPAVRQTRSAT